VVVVEANNARFWVEQRGDGPPIVFLHFGLGDWRVFEPQVRALADTFRCVAYDRRFVGRTEAPNEPYDDVADAIGVSTRSLSSAWRSWGYPEVAALRSASRLHIRNARGRSCTSLLLFPASLGA
jgi:pimeloyl-ACP methyl ester carboxylesterase